MKKMMKVLAVVLCAALLVGIGAGLTLALLAEQDEAVNVMTLGNVHIDQIEQERDADGKLVNFTQAKPLYPAWYNAQTATESIPWADESKWVKPGEQAWKVVEDNENVVDKFVTVKNTGDSEAYVRTIIAYEGDETYGPEGAYIHVVHNGTNVTPAIQIDYLGVAEINGTEYTLYCYTYPQALQPGEVSMPSLKQVYMDQFAGNTVAESYGDTYDILVISQAVQTNGFGNAEAALNAGFGVANAENAADWFSGTKIPEIVDKDNIDDALENGDDVIFGDDMEKPADNSNAYGKTAITIHKGQVIDGANKVLKAVGADGTWDTAINATGGTVKNLTVAQGFRGLFVNHNASEDKCGEVVLENVTIDGCVYTISCDQGTNNGLTATDCTFNGWTSYAATLGKANFIGCSFGEGAGYAFMRPYAVSSFVGCDFEAGYEIDARVAVTFENCTLDGEPLTAENLAKLVTSNIANATVVK